jgi:hypothetical protein
MAQSTARSILVAIACLALAACGNPARPSTAQFENYTFLSLVSEPGEFIGRGKTYEYRLGDGTWTARFDHAYGFEHVVVGIANYDRHSPFGWSFDFVAPKGQKLTLGTYENVQEFPSPDSGHAGIGVTGPGSCSSISGSFTVQQLVLESDETLDRFRATFTVYCGGTSAALRGTVSVVTNPWR